MDYMLHLQRDKKLAQILGEPLPELQLRENIPLRLMASIMSQQLSTKVAKVIYKRFLEIYDGTSPCLNKCLIPRLKHFATLVFLMLRLITYKM
jgi:3-methyladenine DNA glycosylase/8-oxoguanine DNA glycosylase